MNCADCGGTQLDPSVSGQERGTCYCPKTGHIIAHLFYGNEQMPGGRARSYEVEWKGEVKKVEPPTLVRAVEVLNSLRAVERASLGEAQS